MGLTREAHPVVVRMAYAEPASNLPSMRVLHVKISVIIPMFNEADAIASSVDRAWAAGANEVIVVDGESTDESLTIAAGCRCQAIASRRGRAIQQNEGARRATGDVLLFLHADNWLAAGAISQIIDAMQDDCVQGGAFRQRIDSDRWIYRLIERGNAFRARSLKRPYGDQAIFMRHEIFTQLGGFPEIPLMEDVLLMRAFARQAQPILLDGPLHISARRWQKQGVMRQTLRNWALIAALWLGVSPDRLARFYRR